MPETILAKDTSVSKTVGHMKQQIIKAANTTQIKNLAKSFLIYPIPEKAVFNYVYNKVAYVPDEENYQDIRTPQRSLRDGVGNCVDYTVFIGSLLYALKIPFRIKVVEIEQDQGYEHVYIVTNKYALDPCLGQPQDGTADISRPAKGKFNQETIFYNSKFYDMPKLRLLQGTARTSFAVKVAKLTNSYMPMKEQMGKPNTLGVLCLSNCDCKNDCTGMFGAIDTSTEKECRNWCDKAKAKKNSLYPSKDSYWQQKQRVLIDADIAATGDEPAPQVDEPSTSGIENIINNLLDSVFGGGDPTYTPPPTAPSPKIMGMPQNVVLIGGAVIIGGIIYMQTRKKKKKKVV